MTILAGVVSLCGKIEVPPELSQALRNGISRFKDDVVIESISRYAHLFKVDINAFKSRGHFFESEVGTLMIAGEPLIADGGSSVERCHDVDRLFKEFREGKTRGLKLATGTYCGIYFDESAGCLQIFCDKMGVRPIYYAIIDGFIVYTSALRILESIPFIPKVIDVQGTAEIACFGYPLSTRTAYQNIMTVHAGEIVGFDKGGERHIRYWNWAEIANEGLLSEPLAEYAWRLFLDGLQRRLHGEQAVLSFLSGGLDSRAIAGALTELKVKVASINFAPPNTQDQAFAKCFAKSIDAYHSEYPVNADVVNDPHRTKLVRSWIESLRAQPFFSNIKRTILWSGDGGSVGMGAVYLTPDIISTARLRGYAAATDAFFIHNNWSLSPRLFSADRAESMMSRPRDGMLAELNSLGVRDRGKAFYCFLMVNDQRRHLQKHFEAIDLTRLELQLPFFDAALIEFVMRGDIEAYLGHAFYMRWIASSSISMNSTPWQAYPGHVPCHLPILTSLKYQWGGNPFDAITIRRMKQATIKRGLAMIFQRCFPSHLLSRPKLVVIVLALMMGKSHLQYLIKMADAFCRPASVSCRK